MKRRFSETFGELLWQVFLKNSCANPSSDRILLRGTCALPNLHYGNTMRSFLRNAESRMIHSYNYCNSETTHAQCSDCAANRPQPCSGHSLSSSGRTSLTRVSISDVDFCLRRSRDFGWQRPTFSWQSTWTFSLHTRHLRPCLV